MKPKKNIDIDRVTVFGGKDVESPDFRHLNSDADGLHVEVEQVARTIGCDRKTVCQYARRNKLSKIRKYVYQDGLHEDDDLVNEGEGMELVLIPLKEALDYVGKTFKRLQNAYENEKAVADKYRKYVESMKS